MPSLPREGESLSTHAIARKKGDYKVDAATGCWNWQKTLSRTGYGIGSFLSVGIKTNHAHRAYYIAANGPVPPGVSEGVIDHLCRNPRCVNPKHLEWVPAHVNNHRGDIPKITMEDARAIRGRIQAGELMGPIAEEYGVAIRTVYCIAEDLKWREDYAAPRKPIRPEGVHCPYCGRAITSGKRNKKFCNASHRGRFNSRAAYQRERITMNSSQGDSPPPFAPITVDEDGNAHVCCENCGSTNLDLDGWDIDKCHNCGHWRYR